MTNSSDDLSTLLARGWMSLNKFAKLAGISYPTALRYANNGNLQVVRVGGIIRVYTEEAKRFMTEGNASRSEQGELNPPPVRLSSIDPNVSKGDDND